MKNKMDKECFLKNVIDFRVFRKMLVLLSSAVLLSTSALAQVTTWTAVANDPSPVARSGNAILGALTVPVGGKLQIHNSTSNAHVNLTGTGPSLKFSNGNTNNGEIVLGLNTANAQLISTAVTNDFSLMTTTSTGSIIFGTSNGSSVLERFRIAANGNVGIGVTNPSSYKLDVAGTIKSTGLYIPTGAAVNRVLTSDASGNASWQLVTPANVNAWQATGNAIGSSDFIGSTNSFPLIFKSNNTEGFRLTTSGNIGIGDPVPSSKLSIIGADTDNGYQIKLKNSGISSTTIVGIQLATGASTATPTIRFTAPTYAQIPGWAEVFSINNDGAGGVALNANSANGTIKFYTNINGSNQPLERVRIGSDGNVGIGVTNPITKLAVNGTVSINDNYVPTGYTLAVNGKIMATEVAVKLRNDWGDFCFAPDFKLMKLSEVEAYVRQNKHLPGVPSAKEIETNGLQVGEMENILMQKVEQLTLYAIDQEKTIDSQQAKIDKLLLLLEEQNKRIEKLEAK